MTDLFNSILNEYKIPEDWNMSVLLNCFKNKGEATDRRSYRSLKLFEHFKKVIEEEIKRQVSIDSMPFEFMPGRGTIDAIFIARQLQERFLENKKKLFFAFVDLEKSFDRVPKKVVRWSLKKLGVMVWLVRMVMTMYSGSKSRVRINNVLGNKFIVKVGVHQGSVLSPLLFNIVLEAVPSECRNRSVWKFLYADDLVIIAESMKELEDSYCSWKSRIESKGFKVNIEKTKVMVSALNHGPSFQSRKHSCGVCFKGVGISSILCTLCDHWVHKRCSGLKNKLASAILQM